MALPERETTVDGFEKQLGLFTSIYFLGL